MCVKGLVIAIDSVLGLSKGLLENQDKFLTYRCSQDHLELFFNAVRRTGEKLCPLHVSTVLHKSKVFSFVAVCVHCLLFLQPAGTIILQRGHSWAHSERLLLTVEP